MNSSSKKRRRPITDAEKHALRQYVQNNFVKRPFGKALQVWFEAEFSHTPSESTISDILSRKYDRLNEKETFQPDIKRLKASFWPDLKAALFE